MSQVQRNIPNTTVIPLCQCGTFLIYNFYFRDKRFLCLRCGTLYAHPPRQQRSTAEGEAKLAAMEAEFLVNCGSKLFAFGQYWHSCERCNRQPEEEHIYHASKLDWVRLNDGLKWLSDRTGKEFGMVNGDLGHYTELMSAAGSVASPKSLDALRGGL